MYNLRKVIFRRNCLTSYIKKDLHGTAVKVTEINKILIANRGEIACRIIRTAKKLGVKTVAVYSDADRNALHINLADEAYCIGPAPSAQSYLRQDKIIGIARKSKCQAIHPGYGFLSENTEFAELCQKEKFIFIGPPANAIRDMGIKNTSKAIMAKAGVPIIEGYHEDDQSDNTLLQAARKIGFPVMIKAIRGGGGKGMRIALNETEFAQALESARTESQKAFGDSAVLVEKYVTEPRHIEVQIFADQYGNAVHLFERDCSVQRRHQKVIEEAPAPGISHEVRNKLGSAAVRAAKAVGYVGAGTVEFIMDKNDYSFYFMEMNTRLQVEHPVTEAITGLDLVEWQLRVAAGEELPLKQEDVTLKGHAFEARIYAENPRNDFLPGAGKLLYLRTPKISENVRIETGVEENDEVSVHYDPMIAKLVIWGRNRTEALGILKSKLSEYNIAGLDTNIEFIKDLCDHPSFRKGLVHTGFIDEHKESLFPKLQVSNEILAQGALALILYEEIASLKSSLKSQDSLNLFATETGFRLNHVLKRTIDFNIQDESHVVEVQYIEPEIYLMRFNKIGPWRRVSGSLKNVDDSLILNTEVDENYVKSRIVQIKDTLYLFTHNREWQIQLPAPRYISTLTNQPEVDNTMAVSPMPGVVDKVFVKRGDQVNKGDPLLVIVAMKMEYIIRSSGQGIVDEILCSLGENVARGKVLIKLTETTS